MYRQETLPQPTCAKIAELAKAAGYDCSDAEIEEYTG